MNFLWLPEKGHWSRINDQLGTHFAPLYSDIHRIQCYQGVHHALWEVMASLGECFFQNKKIFYSSHHSPYFDYVLKYFSQRSYVLKKIPLPPPSASSLSDFPSSSPPEASSSLMKLFEGEAPLCVLIAEDDPITGELFDNKALLDYTSTKNIPTLILSHHSFHYVSTQRALSPYQTRLFLLHPNLSVALLGKRVPIRHHIVDGLAWNSEELTVSLPCYLKSDLLKEDPPLVTSFESSLPRGALKFFIHAKARLFDRALFYWPDINGFSLVQWLEREQLFPDRAKENSSEEKFPFPIECTSLCRWEGLNDLKYLRETISDFRILRGLIIVPGTLLKSPGLNELFEKAYDEIKKIQNSL